MTHEPDIYVVAVAAAAALFVGVCAVEVALQLRRSVERDRLRFRLFAARQRLFLAARRGLVPVASPAFQGLRAFINVTLRENDVVGAEAYVRLFHPKPGRSNGLLFEGLSEGGVAELNDILLEVGTTMLELYRFNSRAVRFLYWLTTTAARVSSRDPVRQYEAVKHQVEEVRATVAQAA